MAAMLHCWISDLYNLCKVYQLCRAHFARGPLAGTSLPAQQQELASRLKRTLTATRDAAVTMFRAHIDKYMQQFETMLVADGRRYR